MTAPALSDIARLFKRQGRGAGEHIVEVLAEGWQGANIQQELFAKGWHFVPGSDPALTSPLLDIGADRFAAIEIRMANGTAAHDAQLFFAGSDGSISEARSARWTLKPGQAAVTYRIELAGLPGWQGRITRLRLERLLQ